MTLTSTTANLVHAVGVIALTSAAATLASLARAPELWIVLAPGVGVGSWFWRHTLERKVSDGR